MAELDRDQDQDQDQDQGALLKDLEEFTLDPQESCEIIFSQETPYWVIQEDGTLLECFGDRQELPLFSWEPDLRLFDTLEGTPRGTLAIPCFKVSFLGGGLLYSGIAWPKGTAWDLQIRSKKTLEEEIALRTQLQGRSLEELRDLGDTLGVAGTGSVKQIAARIAHVLTFRKLVWGIRQAYEDGNDHLLGVSDLGDASLGLGERYGWYLGVTEGVLSLSLLEGAQIHIPITDRLVIRKCFPPGKVP